MSAILAGHSCRRPAPQAPQSDDCSAYFFTGDFPHKYVHRPGARPSCVSTRFTPSPAPDKRCPAAMAELSVCKSACPHQARRGCYLIYTLLISNTGPAAARDVILEDAAPGELCRAQFTVNEGLTWEPWDGSYALGDIPAGECRAVYVAGIVDRNACGPVLRNTAWVRATAQGPNTRSTAAALETPIQ